MQFLDQASTAAEKVDSVFLFILALSVAFLIFITGLMVYFVIRYSKKRHPKGEDIEGHAWLEITWTVVPLAIFLAMFYFGWTNFEYLRNAPRDAMVIKVLGVQWRWSFEYPNGKKTEQLYLAIDKPVRLEIRSGDVIHGFYAPAFRVKMDAVPGKENYTWFTPTQFGSFDILCSVICGTEHTYMLSKAVVVPLDSFEQWYRGGEDEPPPESRVRTAAASPELPAGHPGLEVLKEKQCLTCHSVDGKVMVGPSFRGAFGSRETVKVGESETQVVVDEGYIRKAIRDPLSEVLKGYPPVMPASALSDQEVEQVIDYIRRLD